MRATKLHLAAALVLGLALWGLVAGVLQAPTAERAAAVAAALAPQAAPLDVVVSEIAWMGTTVAWQDEWIELGEPAVLPWRRQGRIA